VIYDGSFHTATATATGVFTEDLSSSVDLSGTTHSNAGTYGSDIWTFIGGINYNDNSGTVSDDITKADPDCSSIVGYSGVYDANPHSATGECRGVDGGALGGLDLGSSFTNVPGGVANWTFTDSTGNYNSANGSVNINITTQIILGCTDPKATKE